jgi:glycosyltransferase involved in cell wall biosynthesis
MLDQVVVGAAPGDAITRSALLVQGALRALGPSELYAEHREEHLLDSVRSISDLARRPNKDRPLVFHASIGSWPVYRALVENEQELVLVYHNFSPPEFFAEFAPEVAGDLIRGRWELAQLRPRVVASVADSDYNAQELYELGYSDVSVVPPTPDVGRLTGAVPDPAMLARISTWGPGPMVLCVAQQLPHKRIERVLAAMAVLQQEFLPDARLAVVGVGRFDQYSRAVQVMSRTVGLREPHFMGRMTDAELAALYLRASAFLTLTEHEGFCVPVVEAMAAGVPVVAAARAALPGTVGDAGILVDDPDDPVLVAGLLHRVLTDLHLRHVLMGRGAQRARSMAAPVSLPQLVDALLAPLQVGDRSTERVPAP